MCEDREHELVIILESVREIIESHDGIFHLFAIKCLLEEVVELDLIKLTNDKYIYDIVRCLITEIEYSIRYCHEIEGFASFEKLLHWLHHIIRFQKHLHQLRIYR